MIFIENLCFTLWINEQKYREKSDMVSTMKHDPSLEKIIPVREKEAVGTHLEGENVEVALAE